MIELCEFSEQLQIDKKYRMTGESYSDMVHRWLGVLSDTEAHRVALKDIFLNGRHVMAGRNHCAVGNPEYLTCFNCFEMGVIEDNLTKRNGILAAIIKSAESMRMGGGVGFDFSTIRPSDGTASGPVSFLPIFNSMCKALQRGGSGQGAMMGMLRVDHPSIYEYIMCKHPPAEVDILYTLRETSSDPGKLNKLIQQLMPLSGFNLSIFVTDTFMEAVEAQTKVDLVFNNVVHTTIDAYQMWETIMRSTWEYGDPGIFFGDTANTWDNLWYLDTNIIGTNPCGEQPFHPNNSCLLGSFNIVHYVQQSQSDKYFNYDQLRADIPHVVRAIDNIIDYSHYPLTAQRETALNHRRMGLGVMGMANAIELFGYPYGSAQYLSMQDSILQIIRDESYRASALLAKEKGTFPSYSENYAKGKFIQTLPEDIQQLIQAHGIRNSHLTSIAPTGTISLAYNNVSPGIEPVFAMKQERIIQRNNQPTISILEDYGVKYFHTTPKTALECTINDHLEVLIHAQRYVDSAISKTCNVPLDTPWDEFKGIYMRAWKAGCKGITTFTTGGKKSGILKSLDTCTIDPVTGSRDCS